MGTEQPAGKGESLSQKKSGIPPWNRIPDTAYSPTTPVSTGKGAGGKKYAEHRTVNIRSYPSANSVNPSATVTANSMRKKTRGRCSGGA